MPRFLNQVVDEYNETCNKFLSIVGDVCHTMYAASKQSKMPTNRIADEPMFRLGSSIRRWYDGCDGMHILSYESTEAFHCKS